MPATLLLVTAYVALPPLSILEIHWFCLLKLQLGISNSLSPFSGRAGSHLR
jgi:hypothetical protein